MTEIKTIKPNYNESTACELSRNHLKIK